jgi:flagellar hook protein FlgE
MMEGAMSAGVNGLNSALKGLNKTAQDVAELNVARGSMSEPAAARPKDVEDAAEALVSLKLYQRQAQASAKVVETADAVIGFLLDIHA